MMKRFTLLGGSNNANASRMFGGASHVRSFCTGPGGRTNNKKQMSRQNSAGRINDRRSASTRAQHVQEDIGFTSAALDTLQEFQEKRVFNFSAGPATNVYDVMKQAQEEFLNYDNTGMGFIELSHRDQDGPVQKLMTETQDLIRILLSIPENYQILLMPGGAHLQFSAVPMNLTSQDSDTVAFNDTGFWSQRAMKHARKFCTPKISCENRGRLLPVEEWNVPRDSKYIHMCMNETIAGLEYLEDPDVESIGLNSFDTPLVCDATSTLMSRPVDIEKYGMIFASSGKNLGPAGICVAVIRDDLINRETSHKIPEMLSFREHANSQPIQNVYNTPPTFNIYMLNLTLHHYLKQGGLEYYEVKAKALSDRCYDFLDNSSVFNAIVDEKHKKSRSRMNVCFQIGKGDKELERELTREAEANHIHQLFGHPISGGLRLTLYNAIEPEAVEAALDFLDYFECEVL